MLKHRAAVAMSCAGMVLLTQTPGAQTPPRPDPLVKEGVTAFFVAQDRVLFSHDVAMVALPAFSSPQSTIKQWMAGLDLQTRYDRQRIAIRAAYAEAQ